MVCELFLSRTITNKTKHKHTCLVHCIPSVPSLPLPNDLAIRPPGVLQIWKEGPVERSFTTFYMVVPPPAKVGDAKLGIVDVLGLQEVLVDSVDTLQLLQQGGICPWKNGCPMGRGPTAQPLGTPQVSGAPQGQSNWVQAEALSTDSKQMCQGQGLVP